MAFAVAREAGDRVLGERHYDVQLMAVPTRDPSQPTYLIAKAGGPGNDFIQLVLEPGWRLMRRQYGKRTLGHLYVYRDAAPAADAETP